MHPISTSRVLHSDTSPVETEVLIPGNKAVLYSGCSGRIVAYAIFPRGHSLLLAPHS